MSFSLLRSMFMTLTNAILCYLYDSRADSSRGRLVGEGNCCQPAIFRDKNSELELKTEKKKSEISSAYEH